MYVNFEFAALHPSPYSRVKKCAKFKTNMHLVSVDSFLYYLSSSALYTFSLFIFSLGNLWIPLSKAVPFELL